MNIFTMLKKAVSKKRRFRERERERKKEKKTEKRERERDQEHRHKHDGTHSFYGSSPLQVNVKSDMPLEFGYLILQCCLYIVKFNTHFLQQEGQVIMISFYYLPLPLVTTGKEKRRGCCDSKRTPVHTGVE